jgi:small subunit ribosomal protein S11
MAEDTTTIEEKTTESTAPEAVEAPVTTEAKPAAAPAKRRKGKRTVAAGQVHVLATFNNTIITFTDANGGALTASSSGACGFRGSKKGTAYAAQVATERAGNAAKQQYGFGRAEVYVKGVGLGRDRDNYRCHRCSARWRPA